MSHSAATNGVTDPWEAVYPVEEHLKAFEAALYADEVYIEHHGEASSPGSGPQPTPTTSRIRKISALSDWAPVNLKVKKRKKKDRLSSKRLGHDWWFLVLRWPLLLFIFLFIGAEFGIYVLIRQLVNAKEWVSAWRGKKGVLRKKLRASTTYEEWKEAAKELDDYLHFDEWKKIDDDPYYDWRLIKKVGRSLKMLREKKDARGCLGVLETCIRANFAGIESSRLYSETFLGTKDLLESYLDEQEKALEYIRETPDLSIDEKKKFFKSANTNLGISALCLSGGAALGYYHYGVVRAFLDADLLPRVITGTSAGGLIAALTACHTDEELKVLLVPKLADKLTACDEPFSVWSRRLWETGARFDSVIWARKSTWFTRGSMTFKEAYLRTGRILNITVIPADRHSPTKVLNYVTAPDTIIWSTLLASAAVPGIMNPVVLMQKLKDGSAVPWNWGSRFKDGSLRVDIPLQALNLYYNVTHPVVSQVNPHVHLFFFAPRGSPGRPVAHYKGKGWRGNFVLSAAEQWLKHELTKNFKVIRDLELLPEILGQDWSSIFLQRFEGAITIWPKTRASDWARILEDPDPQNLDRMMKVGKLVTWPKLHMIGNRMRIEKQIFLGRQALRKITRTRPRNISPEGITPPPNGSDLPLSVDTDAEAAFSNGTQWFYRRGHHAGTERPGDLEHDPLRSSAVRKKWVADLLHGGTEERNTRSPAYGQLPAGGFFRRLRTNSFPNLRLSGLRENVQERQDKMDVSVERSWSSDSSSDDGVSVEGSRPSYLSSPRYEPGQELDEGEESDVDM
ncbi:patatin-domain-containing protein [Desarmillaria tabescens]|uniref:Patatin-like phospholipase domain-containing protein n=1 Tax=Armillaria tabescens TaxID=1929756 RepID=A0AA39NMI5_ARMTA|nr:patatin-domain-containing protein [Desarmillaria tabescens]KAK0468400.1 patatin-domain-containing protein [Desarmillaria tabescens]